MTKTVRDVRVERLEKQKECPCCGWGRRAFTKEGDESALFMNHEDVATAFSDCGSEFSVNLAGNVIAREACGQPSIDAADQMQQEADDGDTALEDAEAARTAYEAEREPA